MTTHFTSERCGLSTDALRNKFHCIWRRLKSKSNDLAGTLNLIPSLWHKSRSMPIETEVFLFIYKTVAVDFGIPIEDILVVDMIGLALFEDAHDMFAARSKIRCMISIIENDILKSLLSGVWLFPKYTKMLYGSRYLGKSVASSYPSVFCHEIVVGKWPESNLFEDCYALSLVLKRVNEHPVNLECPKIALLQLKYRQDSQSLPVDFFEGMKEVRVVSLDVPSLPQSLNMLSNLRTLHLKVPKFEDMSSIGGLVNLEFLSISTVSFAEIPWEIGQLENLKFLDLRKMSITYIPPGALSRLLKLEELYLPLTFTNWGCKAKKCDDYDEFGLEEHGDCNYEERINAVDDEERINASLTEITSLSLNALQICVPKASVLPKRSSIFKNIQEFKILMPNNVLYQLFGKSSINVLQLTGEVCDIKESGICDLLSRVEDLNLIRVQNLKNVIYQLEDNGFPNLKKMIFPNVMSWST